MKREIIILSNLTYMKNITDIVAIGVEIPRIGRGCSLEKSSTN